MENIALIGSVLLVHLLATISPGPDFVVAVKNSMSYSRKTGTWTAIGCGLGISIHIMYCVAGLAVVISKYILLFDAIKYLGAAYLVYLGIASAFSKSSRIKIQKETKKEDISRLAAVRIGFFTNVLNPKATLYFLSVFTFALSPTTPHGVVAFISLGMIVITMIWFSLVSVFFTQKKMLAIFNHYQGVFNKTLGGVLILLGIKVAFMHK